MENPNATRVPRLGGKPATDVKWSTSSASRMSQQLKRQGLHDVSGSGGKDGCPLTTRRWCYQRRNCSARRGTRSSSLGVDAKHDAIKVART